MTLLSLLLFASCDRAARDPDAITVFAASSTQDFVSAIGRRYEEQTGVRVRLNVAASSTLARQIEAGARADVYVSAHPMWMNRLEEKGLMDAASRRDVLGNGLALVIPAQAFLGLVTVFRMDHDLDFEDAWTGRIAVADPEHVPAGIYARQAMTALGWWDDVEDQIVPTANARAAVRLVAMAEVQAGIAYRSDAARFDGVAEAAIFPAESHEPIRYPAALLTGADPRAGVFLDAMSSDEGKALAESLGFLAPARKDVER